MVCLIFGLTVALAMLGILSHGRCLAYGTIFSG
jgi:hypothetical protein